jgi:hypothetical protein
MAALLEFVVMGTPVSSGGGKSNLRKWRRALKEAAQAVWRGPPLKKKMCSTLIHFHKGEAAPLDNDNMSKVIHDALNKLVYADDRQVVDTHAIQISLDAGAISLEQPSALLIATLALKRDFLYLNIRRIY